MEEMETKEAYGKAKFFFSNDTTIHVNTNTNSFYNGKILQLNSDHIILQDRIFGETYLLFSEIKTMTKYKERTANDLD